MRSYVKAAADAVAELTARVERLVGRLTLYSHGESRPDPAAHLKALLDNLHGLEDERDERSSELTKLDRTMNRSAEVSAEQIEQKARLEAELARISKRISELDRRATGERAKLLRHAEEHFAELCCDCAWLVQIGLGVALAGDLELARSGVLRIGARFSDYALRETLQEAGGKSVYRVNGLPGP